MFIASARLKTIYNTYNRKYFDGQLPSETLVGWNDELGPKTFGLNISVADEGNHLLFTISIDPRKHFSSEQYRLTLLHEMCHIKLYPYMKHGKKFNEEMLRLAVRGALNELW